MRLTRILLIAVLAVSCSESPRSPTAPAPPGAFTLSGHVREQLADGPGQPIANARIEVVYKAGAGGSAVTDANGRYQLDGVSALHFELRVTRDGFEPATQIVTPLTGDTTVDVRLVPRRRVVTRPAT